MKKINIIELVVALFFLLTGCVVQKVSGNYTHTTECIGVEMDGSQTVKAWGGGGSREDAVEQAKKNAIRDVLFNGITNGKSECDSKPVVPEVNAQKKYEDYFNKFFAKDGEYSKFIAVKSMRREERIAGELGTVTYGLILKVLRSDLKQKMIADGMLK